MQNMQGGMGMAEVGGMGFMPPDDTNNNTNELENNIKNDE